MPCAVETVLQVDGVRRPGEPDKTFNEGTGRIQGRFTQGALPERTDTEQQVPRGGKIRGRRRHAEEPLRQIDQLPVQCKRVGCGPGSGTGNGPVNVVTKGSRRRDNPGVGQSEPIDGGCIRTAAFLQSLETRRSRVGAVRRNKAESDLEEGADIGGDRQRRHQALHQPVSPCPRAERSRSIGACFRIVVVVNDGKIDGRSEGRCAPAVASRCQNGQRAAPQASVPLTKSGNRAAEELTDDHVEQVGEFVQGLCGVAIAFEETDCQAELAIMEPAADAIEQVFLMFRHPQVGCEAFIEKGPRG